MGGGNTSAKPVNYATGELKLGFTDISARSFGRNWSYTRDYGNRTADSFEGSGGFGWSTSFIPTLTVSGGVATVQFAPLVIYYFDEETPGQFVARFYFRDRFVFVFNTGANQYELKTPKGRTYLFTEVVGAVEKVFAGTIEPDGGQIEATYETGGSQRLLSLLREDGGVQTGFTFGYSGDSDQRTSVFLKLSGVDVQRANYVYYNGESGGSAGDLKKVTLQRPNPSTGAWQTLGSSYYRFYVEGEIGGFEHGLKFVLEPEAYFRMQTAGVAPETATDAQLAGYADYYFRYDSRRRVAFEATNGGVETYLFEYFKNSQPLESESLESHSTEDPIDMEFNRWSTKTVVTMADGSQEVAYSNQFGQVMLKLLRSYEGEWGSYTRFDDEGRAILRARPSAIATYDESLPYLVTLHAAQGLVEITRFYWEAVDGGAPGRIQSIHVQEGEFGEEIPVRGFKYLAHSALGRTYYLIFQETTYLGVPGSDETAVREYAYTWHGATTVVSRRTTTLPVIPVEQNGSGLANQTVQEFDEFGNLTSRSDENGSINTWEWDPALGGIVTQVVDAERLALTTNYTLDESGRIVAEAGPAFLASLPDGGDGFISVLVRPMRWTVYRDSAHEIRFLEGYRNVSGTPIDHVVSPLRLQKMDRAGRIVEQISVETGITTVVGTGSAAFAQADYCRWTRLEYDNQARFVGQRVYHHIPADGDGSVGFDYGETRFGYDFMGRRCVTVSPGGTITRSVLDARGLSLSTWVGTNDVGASARDPGGSGAAGNNMVQIETREYDRGASGGNGWLTEVIAYAGAADARVSTYDYDFRGRQVVVRGEHGFRETYVKDNLGRATTTERWNDEGVTPLRVARNDTLFDKLGRVFRTIRYSVDPVTGALGASLADDTWYDAVGNVMKQRNPEDAGFEKLAYDGANRVLHRYAGYNTVDSSYSEAGSVANDMIFEQSDYTYDDASIVIQEIKRERFHNTSGLGALKEASGTAPNARVLYQMYYEDALKRSVASTNYGTNGGTTPTRPDTVPEPSDTVLVSTTEYNARGEVASTIDPKGTKTVQEFDDAGRLVKTIENFQPPVEE